MQKAAAQRQANKAKAAAQQQAEQAKNQLEALQSEAATSLKSANAAAEVSWQKCTAALDSQTMAHLPLVEKVVVKVMQVPQMLINCAWSCRGLMLKSSG